MWGGGGVNEMCESKHTMPSEMGGGGKGVEPKGGHCFSKKILNPVRLKFERNNFFSNDIFCKFLPTLQIGGFLREFLLRKNLVFTAGQVSK